MKQNRPSIDEAKGRVVDDYEAYDGDYQDYAPRYASYSKKTLSNHEIIIRKLTKKKWWILSIVLFLSIVGILIGITSCFTSPSGNFFLSGLES